jgi:hypothetical protein
MSNKYCTASNPESFPERKILKLYLSGLDLNGLGGVCLDNDLSDLAAIIGGEFSVVVTLQSAVLNRDGLNRNVPSRMCTFVKNYAQSQEWQ